MHRVTRLLLISVSIVFLHAGQVQRPTDYVWPPKEFIDRVNEFSRDCRTQSGVSEESVRAFSDSDDLDSLPHDHELMCYLNCLFVKVNVTTVGSLKYNITRLIEELTSLPKYSHDIIYDMSKGCFTRKIHSDDACEKSYLINLCFKRNDLQHYAIY